MIGRFLEVWRMHRRIRVLEAERAAATRTRRLAIDEELIPLLARAIALSPSMPSFPLLPPLWKREREPQP